MKNFLHHNFPGILWIAFMLVLTCIPGTLIPQVPTYLDLFDPDKLVHIFLFAVLVFLILLGLRKQFHVTPAHRFAVYIALNIGVFLGGITELLQGTTLITGRQCSVYDFIADIAGCFLGWGVYVLWKKRKTSNARRSL
ncbi:MAG TPA: VanZ family protein [Bacteroidales bacterium]|nr:VanZ family protein [Bacteroidales bacterium]